LVQGSFFLMICTSPTHSMHPFDSTDLIGHKIENKAPNPQASSRL
jgi:hypothetical protein